MTIGEQAHYLGQPGRAENRRCRSPKIWLLDGISRVRHPPSRALGWRRSALTVSPACLARTTYSAGTAAPAVDWRRLIAATAGDLAARRADTISPQMHASAGHAQPT